MKKDIKVAIFTMAYNAEHTICRTVDSVLSQTFQNFQYFLLDNGSTDKTTEIVGKYGASDERIVPLFIKKNDPTNGGPFFQLIVNATDADYFVWLDADDEYTPDFLENMVNFACENNLDIAACGYDKIDGITNEVIKHRALHENLVIFDDLFTERFIDYRGFMMVLWGKLYSIPFLRDKKTKSSKSREANGYTAFWDASFVHNLCKDAQRIGIYGKSMHRYYQYARSLTHSQIENNVKGIKIYYNTAKRYLESYGPISDINQQFLYAIFLSLVEEIVGYILSADVATEYKLTLLMDVYSDKLWKETLECDADPMFHSLAARDQVVSDMKEKILGLENIEQYAAKQQCLFTYFMI